MKKILLGLAVMACAAQSMAFAGHRAGAISLGLGTGYYRFAEKRDIQNTSIPNVSLGYDLDEHWGIQGDIGVLNSNKKGAVYHKQGVHGILYTVDGLYHFNARGHFVPYVLAGVGVMSLKPSYDDPTNLANVNVGVGGQYFFSDSIAFGLEGKDIYTLTGGKNDIALTAAVTFLFGGEGEKPVVRAVQNYKGDV